MPNAQQVCAELLKRDILVDYRPKAGVRFSPHFYNTDEEITSAINAVEEILSGMQVGRKVRTLWLIFHPAIATSSLRRRERGCRFLRSSSNA